MKEFPQVALSVEPEAVGHDLTGQAVTAKQRLHAVGNLHLWTRKESSEERYQKVAMETQQWARKINICLLHF